MSWNLTVCHCAIAGLFFCLCSARLTAADAATAFLEFQTALRSAQARSSSRPPISNQAEADAFLERVTTETMDMLKRAKDFEVQFPSDPRTAQIGRELGELLFNVFGTGRFPVPQSGAREIERFAEVVLKNIPDDLRMNLVLYRAADALPSSQQLAIYDRLIREPVPEPVRDLAQKALRKLDRLNKLLDLSFKALDGRAISASDYKGKVVLINFWATWCGPCIRELPLLKKLYAEQRPHGLEIIGISLDSDRQVLDQFLGKEQISWPQFFEAAGASNRIAKTFEIGSIPVVWLLDRKGNLRELNVRAGPGLESAVKELLAEESR